MSARPPLGRTLMVQGTASHVGKSWLAAGICRLLAQDGWRVQPFKGQNMSNNAAVTADGGEIGRSQALQAEAAGIAPHTDHNPVLLKPSGRLTSQVVLQGRPAGTLRFGPPPAAGQPADGGPGPVREETPAPGGAPVPPAASGSDLQARAWQAIVASLGRLRARADVVVIEGAGSPAELNLRDQDLANMAIAELADAPVLLVADIDRGGVFASLLGTLDLLRPRERARVKGLVVNRFHGDPALFAEGVRLLEERSALPVLGVLPWLDLDLPEEDAVAIERGAPAPSGRPGQAADLFIAVLRLPHASNLTDFAALASVPGVLLRYVDRPAEAARAAAVILPGTKNAVADLGWLRARGWPAALGAPEAGAGNPHAAGSAGATRPPAPAAPPGPSGPAPLILGVCGGMQMLGRTLRDPDGVEDAPGTTPGLALLPAVTTFRPGKRTVLTEAAVAAGAPPWLPGGHRFSGYEIRAGTSETAGDWLDPRGLSAASPDGRVLGCYVHGLFDDRRLRQAFVQHLRRGRGLAPLPDAAFAGAEQQRQEALDALAAALRRHLDCAALYRLCGLVAPERRGGESQ